MMIHDLIDINYVKITLEGIAYPSIIYSKSSVEELEDTIGKTLDNDFLAFKDLEGRNRFINKSKILDIQVLTYKFTNIEDFSKLTKFTVPQNLLLKVNGNGHMSLRPGDILEIVETPPEIISRAQPSFWRRW